MHELIELVEKCCRLWCQREDVSRTIDDECRNRRPNEKVVEYEQVTLHGLDSDIDKIKARVFELTRDNPEIMAWVREYSRLRCAKLNGAAAVEDAAIERSRKRGISLIETAGKVD